MKLTLSWLRTYLDTDASVEAVAERLTALGLEIEAVENQGEALAPFTVAHITATRPHPNADRLKLCTVESRDGTLEVVCGAPNARQGIKVALAREGAKIPSTGQVLKKASIRGIESQGMLCSASELALGEDSSGILELPEEAEIGAPIAAVLGLDDTLFDINVTPNRGDCLGVYGVARDLAASGLGTLQTPEIPSVPGTYPFPLAAEVQEPSLCPRFLLRHFKIQKNGPSPSWLQQRLKSIGMEPISALVDITNFLTLDLGRPAHVYDAATLKEGLFVRGAKEGESLLALDDASYALHVGMPVVADASGPVALGGIIGGKETGCSEETKEVVLEIAVFDPLAVAKAGRLLQIDTDARARFERGVDARFAESGMAIASRLILSLCGGTASEVTTMGEAPAPTSFAFAPEKLAQVTGLHMEEAVMQQRLQALGCQVETQTTPWQVTPPSWRHDLHADHDVVEELARLEGYDAIAAQPLPPPESGWQPPYTPAQDRVRMLRRTMSSRSAHETIGFSFVSKEAAMPFLPKGANPVTLANPISQDLSVMRPSLIPGLLHMAKKNTARKQGDHALFEIGPVFTSATPQGQVPRIASVRTGWHTARNPHMKERSADWLDAKADALALLDAAGVDASSVQIAREVPDYMHPGCSGVLKLGNIVLGLFGALHPTLCKAYDLPHAAVVELYLDCLPPVKKRKPKALASSNFPDVERDFAFITDAKTSVQDLLQAAKRAAGKELKSITLFDVYQGEHVEEGKKSVAFGVRLQPQDHTLSEQEIQAICDAIVAQVTTKTSATLRV